MFFFEHGIHGSSVFSVFKKKLSVSASLRLKTFPRQYYKNLPLGGWGASIRLKREFVELRHGKGEKGSFKPFFLF
jgi:hypothetical protein